MLKVTFSTTLFVLVIIPSLLFGQSEDSLQTEAAPSGISEEKVSAMLDSLRNELSAKSAELEDSLNVSNKMKLDSLRKTLTDRFKILQDSLRTAVSVELTTEFEKKSVEPKLE